MKSEGYKFSVVIPIYKVEKYLRETIDSVIGQTIGFEENIELILVNDGSPDGCGDICREYLERYPKNIVYIEKENGGVSSARNAGLERASGKYVNFLDSDDKWEPDAFENAYDFLQGRKDEVNVAACRIKFFEAKEDYHVLDYVFEENESGVYDITDPQNAHIIQISASSAFIRREFIGGQRFVDGMRYGEDGLFINSLILKSGALALLKQCVYRYRRRLSETSAVQKQGLDPQFYISSPEIYYSSLLRLSRELYGRAIEYIQNVVYYDVGWHLYQNGARVLGGGELERSVEILRSALSEVDDSVILFNRVHRDINKKAIAYSLKHPGLSLFDDTAVDAKQGILTFGGEKILSLKRSRGCLRICFFGVEKDKITIEGIVSSWLFNIHKKSRLFFKLGDITAPAVIKPYHPGDVEICTGAVHERLKRFVCTLSVEDKSVFEQDVIKIHALMTFGKKKCRIGLSYGKFITSRNDFSSSYTIQNNCIINFYRTVIKLFPQKSRAKAVINHIKCELEVLRELKRLGRRDIAALRKRYFLKKRQLEKSGRIWLISDRADNAGDNAEVFFKYLCAHKPKGVRPIFVIGKDAGCAQRLKSEGETIFLEDRDFPLYFLCAERIISSSAGEFTINPFGKDRIYVQDLFRFKYYYLQHGVACADLSSWINRFSKNPHRIFTSSPMESKAFLEAGYMLKKQNVCLTGMARFDELYSETKKQILILPTWRRYIRESYNEKTVSVYFDGFKSTRYFQFYNRLINDERLLTAMRRHGYRGLFCLHPIHAKQSVDFCANDVFSINEGFVDYNRVFADSALMVTDYSSVVFDFAYLRKSIIYTQFDRREFFEGQIYNEGYFSYESHGFGPVCDDYESTVSAIIEYIENDCVNPPQYVERVNSFFKFDDKNNCKRILKQILKS